MASAMANPSSVPSLAELKNVMYARCWQAYSTNNVFGQSEILAMGLIPDDDVHVLFRCAQELVNEGLFKVHRMAGDQAMWKVIKKEDAAKYQYMTPDEAIVFGYIESSGREAIWSRTLKSRSNLHDSVMSRAIRSLESHGFIKPIKSVKFPHRNYYMLAHLTPSEDVTGGPWYTDGELDNEFVDTLSQQVERYVHSKSFHRNPAVGSSTRRANTRLSKSQINSALDRELGTSHSRPQDRERHGDKLLHFPPGYQGYPTLFEIMVWLNESKISEVPLGEEHIRQLLDVLYYDGKVARVLGGTAYKSLRPANTGNEVNPTRADGNSLTEAPCGRCPVFSLCEEGGPVSASNCQYFKAWLDI